MRPKFDEVVFRRLVDEGRSIAEIAAVFGASPCTVKDWLRRIGVRVAPQRLKMPADVEDRVVGLYRSGSSMSQIARILGLKANAASRALRRRGVMIRQNGTGRPVRGPDPVPRDDAPPEVPTTLAGRLIATKGKWAALSQIAAQQGWSSAKAQQEYHRARATA